MSVFKHPRVKPAERAYGGFLNIEKVEFDFQGAGGKSFGPFVNEVMNRGNSAAVLLFNLDRQCVVLVRQPRVAVYEERNPDGMFLLELPAGKIEPDGKVPGRFEPPDATAMREAYEETGYIVRSTRPVATILPSPGGTSERIHILYADVRDTDFDPAYRAKVAQEGRPDTADEMIEVVHMPVHEFLDMIDGGEAIDAKLLVAAQWLRRITPAAPNPTLEPGEICYAWTEDLEDPHRKKRPRILGIQTGPLDEVTGIDLWVNAENTDMQMARFFDPGISASIRYLGAAKHRNGTMFADTVADDLKRKLAGQVAVKASTIVVTTAGDLRFTHRVKNIIHLACAQHSPGGRVLVDPAAAAEGLKRALLEAENRSRQIWRRWLFGPTESILIPLIGSGNGGAKPQDIVDSLLPVVIKHLEKHEGSSFRKLYFLAYKQSELDLLRKGIDKLVERGVLSAVDGDVGGVRQRRRRRWRARRQKSPPPKAVTPDSAPADAEP